MIFMKILIAEDSRSSRMMLESMLTKWGYTVVAACDGGEAWEKLQEGDELKLAIVDWMMPVMDGDEVCRRLRKVEKLKSLYVIMLTGKEGKNSISEALEAGADDYLSKPFNGDELKMRVDLGRRIVELQTKLQHAHDRIKELEM